VTLYIKGKDGEVTFKVLVQPRASKNEIVGIYGDCLKVRITSPPIKNQANMKLCEFLSELIDIGKGEIEIIRGQRARVKEVRISGSTLEEVRSKLNHLI